MPGGQPGSTTSPAPRLISHAFGRSIRLASRNVNYKRRLAQGYNTLDGSTFAFLEKRLRPYFPPLHQQQLEGVKHRTPHKQTAKNEKREGLEERAQVHKNS